MGKSHNGAFPPRFAISCCSSASSPASSLLISLTGAAAVIIQIFSVSDYAEPGRFPETTAATFSSVFIMVRERLMAAVNTQQKSIALLQPHIYISTFSALCETLLGGINGFLVQNEVILPNPPPCFLCYFCLRYLDKVNETQA